MTARSKADVRTDAKRFRSRVEPERDGRDRALVAGLREWLVERSGVVVLFDALPGEPDLGGLTSMPPVLEGVVRLAITRTPDSGFDLTVHPVGVSMERHRFGYRQPVATAPVIPDGEVSVVLVPALAFDRLGNRVGFGAGYYDRFLARLPQALRVGVADHVVDDVIPVEPFDIAMTHLATLDGVHEVPLGGSGEQ